MAKLNLFLELIDTSVKELEIPKKPVFFKPAGFFSSYIYPDRLTKSRSPKAVADKLKPGYQ